MPSFRTLDDVDVNGKRVLLRVDLNVPMKDGKVTDATRIERMAPTIDEIARKGGKVILLSHLGRPKGRDPKETLAPLADEVASAIGRPVVVRRRLRRRAGQGRGRPAQGRRGPAAGEHPLPRRRGKERPGIRARARRARRCLRQRRVLGRAPRPRLDRGRRSPAAGLCGPQHAGRARRARKGAGRAGTSACRHRRRRQGVDQARTARQPDRQGQRADHRRRHGQHLPARDSARTSASRWPSATWCRPRATS